MRARLVLFGTCVFCLGLLFLAISARAVTPRITDAVCQFGEELPHACLIPLRVRSALPTMWAQFTLELPARYPRLYHFRVLGCLEELWVNGEPVRDRRIPFCHEPLGKRVDLSSYLHAGTNLLSLRTRNAATFFLLHELTVEPSRLDPLMLLLTLLLLSLIAGYGIFLIAFFARYGSARFWLWLVFLGGILLRILYVSATPVSVRSYDWQSHLQYIAYVGEHFRIPPAQLGWETYQPPLYYVLAAFWAKVVEDLQILSLLLSIATLAVGFWIATMLFPRGGDKGRLLLFAALLATSPALVFFASRVSNDVLLQLFAFLFLGLLIRWWWKGRDVDWFLSSVVMGLGVLTKSSAFLFLPVAYLCLFLKRGVTLRAKGTLLLLSFGIVLLLSGGLLALRFGFEGETSFIGNIERHRPEVLMGDARQLEHFLTFNPLRLLQFPYNDQWDDMSGRKYFFEYFLRSLYFGDFHFGGQLLGMSTLLLLLTLLLLPVVVLGFLCLLVRNDAALPLVVTFLVLLPGHMVYRFLLPQATTQDVRFSILVLLPLAYFLLSGLAVFPPLLRRMGQGCTLALIGVSAIFLMVLHVIA